MWTSLSNAGVGDKVFIRSFAGDTLGPGSEDGYIATVVATSGGRTDEHYILTPEVPGGTPFEHHNSDWIYRYEPGTAPER